jgi:uncharacterized protein YjbI with pentapeptide repeats
LHIFLGKGATSIETMFHVACYLKKVQLASNPLSNCILFGSATFQKFNLFGKNLRVALLESAKFIHASYSYKKLFGKNLPVALFLRKE